MYALFHLDTKQVIPLGDEQLIPQFVQSYYAAQAAILSGKRDAAAKAYQELLFAYSQLAASSLGRAHKELAHEQVQHIYEDITKLPSDEQNEDSNARLNNLTIKDYFMLGAFAFLIFMVLFFKPAYIGLATAEQQNSAPQWVGTQTEYTIAQGGM